MSTRRDAASIVRLIDVTTTSVERYKTLRLGSVRVSRERLACRAGQASALAGQLFGKRVWHIKQTFMRPMKTLV